MLDLCQKLWNEFFHHWLIFASLHLWNKNSSFVQPADFGSLVCAPPRVSTSFMRHRLVFFNRFAQYGRFHEISFIDWNIILISLPSSWYENTVLTSFSVSKESVLFEMVFAKTSIRPLCCMLEFITIFMKRKHCLPINIFVFLWWDDFFLPFCRLWKSVFFETVFAKTGFSYDGPILLEFSMYHLEVGQCWEEYEKWDGYKLDSVQDYNQILGSQINFSSSWIN